MADLPPRSPDGPSIQVRRFTATYWGPRIVGQSGFLVLLLSAVGGAWAGGALFGGRVLLGLAIGALLGAVVFEILFRRWVKDQELAIDESHRDMARNREEEFERKLADAKEKGDFDRFGSDEVRS